MGKKNLKSILLFGILIFSSISISAQASWSYTVWFNIEDTNGNKIKKKDFIKGDIKLFSIGHGAHSDNEFEYDAINKSFKFSQHTISSNSVLVFVQGKDTTTVEIATQGLYIDKILLTGETYRISAWKNKDLFIPNKKFIKYGNVTVFRNKFPLDSYLIEKNEFTFYDNLIKVKIKKRTSSQN